MNTDKILTYAGLGAASRSVVYGADLVLKEIRKSKRKLCVLLANDASDRTTKQISDKCAFYNVPLVRLDCNMETLGKRLGKISPTAVAAITNRGLCEQIEKCAAENQ